MDNEGAVLIAAISGRALAASARRAGYLPLVTDFFGDQDTLNVAHAHVRLVGDLARGIEEEALLRALETLSRCREPLGIVCGTGFEDRLKLLDRIASRWHLFGNRPETIAKVKDPMALAAISGRLGIPFPESRSSIPSASTDWLAKRKGGAGGAHIKVAQHSNALNAEIYYQRKVSGTPISALFVADGRRAVVLGFSAQWSFPTPHQPYRYGGAVRPAALARYVADSLTSAIDRLVPATSLVGLNSADFMVDEESIWLLEINPRPGATLDIFEPSEGSLLASHIAACCGKLMERIRYPEGAKAAAIVYAEKDVASVPALDWPDWTADRPHTAGAIEAGEPLCTVYACSSTAAGARALTNKRRQTILEWMHAGKS